MRYQSERDKAHKLRVNRRKSVGLRRYYRNLTLTPLQEHVVDIMSRWGRTFGREIGVRELARELDYDNDNNARRVLASLTKKRVVRKDEHLGWVLVQDDVLRDIAKLVRARKFERAIEAIQALDVAKE